MFKLLPNLCWKRDVSYTNTHWSPQCVSNAFWRILRGLFISSFLFVYALTQETYISLSLKIRCQKPPNVLNRSHRLQFGSVGLYCVARCKKTPPQKCSDISSLYWWGVTLQTSGIKGSLKTFNSLFSLPWSWKSREQGAAPRLSCSFVVSLSFSLCHSSSLAQPPHLISTVFHTPFLLFFKTLTLTFEFT